MQTFKDNNGVEYEEYIPGDKSRKVSATEVVMIIPKQKEIPEWEKYGFTTEENKIVGYTIEGSSDYSYDSMRRRNYSDRHICNS